MTSPPGEIRLLLSGGDRRSIADSNRARLLIENNPSLVMELAALTTDDDWLVTQRALDLLEKLAHQHADWIAPHKKIFIGPLAASDKWEIRLQIVRALTLFRWSPAQARRVEEILLENVGFPQTFVRAWALDGLATFAERKATLMPIVRTHLRDFERSPSKALQARAKQIRARLTKRAPPQLSRSASGRWTHSGPGRRKEHGQARAAVGFTVKSGWASAVLLAGPPASPRVVDSRRIDLSDPAIPESRQPYHAGFGTARDTGDKLSRLIATVNRFGRQSVTRVIRDYEAAGYHLRGAGVVVGSLIDPARIANDHIRIHALEGQLFRGVVHTAAVRSRLRCSIWRDRDLHALAADSLRLPAPAILETLAALGRAVDGPWRAEQKLAALAAWVVMSGCSR